MRILHLTAGTGRWHCGTCIRDDGLVKGLRAIGHEAELVPLYLPIVADGPSACEGATVQMGGVNCYLQQASGLFRSLPPWLDAPLSSRPILDLAGRFAGRTRPESLGAMTVSMLEGEEGHQAKEIHRLLDHLRTLPRPDVVVLSNSMLGGLVGPLRDALGVPVVLTVQGEAPFLDALDEGRAEAWALAARVLDEADGIVAVSGFAADRMAERTGLPRDRFAVVHNGVAVPPEAADPGSTAPRVGFLARLYAPKNPAGLVDALQLVAGDGRKLSLVLAGTVQPGDHAEVAALRRRVRVAGLEERTTWHTNLSVDDKHALLASLDLFCVPTAKDETFGMYNLEALAAGLPVVAPERGAIPEVIGASGGALLVPPDDTDALVDALVSLVEDPARRRAMGATGRAWVKEHRTLEHMASDLVLTLEARGWV